MTESGHVSAYTRLAFMLGQYFDKILYVTVGQGLPLHSWSEN